MMNDTVVELVNNNSLNISGNISKVDSNCLPNNTWCGDFGAQQYVEIIYLGLIVLLGVFGNFVLITSICFEKRVYKNGNIFIINLAFADLLITGLYTPTVIGNVIEGKSMLSLVGCQVFGYIIITTCSCSMWNLAFIALNRYIAITYSKKYKSLFSKNKSLVMVAFTWLWSILLASPTLYGWTTLIYDLKSMVCAWDDTKSISFALFLIVLAILLPLLATIFFYWKLFWNVRHRSRRSMRVIAPTQSQSSTAMRQKSLRREISLLKTLATAVFVFVLFWAPYSFCVLINPKGVSPLIKKICTWLGLNNSAVNFVIYGVMNQGYREGYKKLFAYFFCKSYVSKRKRFVRTVSRHSSSRFSSFFRCF